MDREPLTPSTGVVALFFVLCVAVGGSVASMVRYDLIGFSALPRCALIAIVLLLLTNLAVRPLLRRNLFGTGRLMYVYLAVVVIAALPGQQMVTPFYTSLVGPAFYASSENHYRELFFEHIPAWSVPSLNPANRAVKWAYYGLPPGATIPWQEWVLPLACWSGFFLLLFLNYLCLAGLFQRQWSQRQRMLFPLAEIPFQMARYRGNESLPGPFRSAWFWLAFLLPFTIHGLNGLHAHYPQITGIDIAPRYLENAFASRPWNVLNPLSFAFYFDVIGITYLLPADVSFSLWFFWLLKYVTSVVRTAAGRTDTLNYGLHVGVGTYVMVAAVTVWQARESLREIGRTALGMAEPTPPSLRSGTPPVPGGAGRDGGVRSPRPTSEGPGETARRDTLAFWGFWITAAGLILFYRALGADWGLAVLGLGLSLIGVLVVSRIISEAGIYCVWSPMRGSAEQIDKVFGPERLGAGNVTALSLFSRMNSDTASLTLASIFQGLKVGELGGLKPMHVLGLITTALTLGVVAVHPMSLYSIYSRGIPALGWIIQGSGNAMPSTIANYLNHPEMMYVAGNYGNMALGAAVFMVLSIMQARFLWWPLHPMGWAAAASITTSERFGFSFLVGWMFHRLALKSGGYQGYKRLQPIVLGLIIGNGLILLVWTIIHYFYPISGALLLE